MSTHRLHFKSYWIAHIIVAIVLAILILLGFWQLHRFDEKRLLETKFASGSKLAPLTLAQTKNLTTPNYETVQIAGYFDNAHSFLLDNQFYKHRMGYQVITPLIIQNDARLVLINRGWIPQGPFRKLLPNIPVTIEKVNLKGLIYIPKKNPFISNELESITWPQRIESVDLSTISQRLHHPIYPWILLLDPENRHGFIRNWQPTTMKSSMHMGYAIQWFLMAAVLLFIYIKVYIKRKTPC